MRRAVALGFVGLLALPSGCRRAGMARIESLRDALAAGDGQAVDSVVSVPECANVDSTATTATCLDAAARAFGAKSFSADKPDQASAAAVAWVLMKNGRVALASADIWLEAVARAPGVGADALRLAIATGLARGSQTMPDKIDDEAGARVLFSSTVRSIPGACATYERLGRGEDLARFAPADSPDHSPCVQHDLTRKDGPGAAYGDGLWRAAAGAAGLWRDAARSLSVGIGASGGAAREALEKKLEVIEGSREMTVRRVETSQTGEYGKAPETHEAEGVLGGDAGRKPRP